VSVYRFIEAQMQSVLDAAEQAGRQLTRAERSEYDAAERDLERLNGELEDFRRRGQHDERARGTNRRRDTDVDARAVGLLQLQTQAEFGGRVEVGDVEIDHHETVAVVHLPLGEPVVTIEVGLR